jgi:pimeloyl-ACP methyl ester carboxylesterase
MDARVDESVSLPQEKSTNDRSIVHIPAPIRFGLRLGSWISPALGAEMARQLFFRPIRAGYRKEQKAILATAQHISLEVRQRRVQAYCWGNGPTVVLIHGWGGHSGQMTEFVKPLTEAGYRVVAVDAPGHGRSRRGMSSLIHFADAIEAAAFAFGPIHAVIAHSLGAAATVQAMLRGVSIDRAVFIALRAHLSSYWHIFRDAAGMSEEVWTIMQIRTERWLNISYDNLHPINHAPRMTTPLLVLHGKADRLNPLSEGETLAAAWPNAEFKAFDCGHMAILRDGQALLAARDFVRG